MNVSELNDFIKNYLEQDKTHGAILLTGGWGTGKSFYVQNELSSRLEKDGKKRCVIVSLYGLKDTTEISKSIYLELRVQPYVAKIKSWMEKTIKKVSKKATFSGEATSAIYGVGKSLLKGIISSKIELSIDDGDLKRLFESVNLSDKLIVLEDVERSEIDPLQLLGYVNGLVSQDYIKVMLVANEEEFLKYISKETDSKGLPPLKNSDAKVLAIEQIPTEETTQYLRIKEKTISDTIIFENDYCVAIRNIIMSFESDVLNKFLNEEDLEELQKILAKGNLRSFIFACQKMNDIYEKIETNIIQEDSILKTMFYGIVLFSQTLKKGDSTKWNGDSNLSTTFGGIKYPLFKFCYDYITKHEYNDENAKKNIDAYKELQLYSRDYAKEPDEDISTITYYYHFYEKNVREAIENIERRLLDPSDISFFVYHRLSRSLIQISRILDVDITTCKKSMVKNLQGLGNKINEYLLFQTGYIKGDPEEEQEWEDLKSKMIVSLRNSEAPFLGFDYTPKTLETFYYEALKEDRVFDEQQPFAKNLDMGKLTQMLFECSPEEIEMIRGIFRGVYRLQTIKDYLSCDKESITDLMEQVKTIFVDDRFDKIQKLQIEWFIKNLEHICGKL